MQKLAIMAHVGFGCFVQCPICRVLEGCYVGLFARRTWRYVYPLAGQDGHKGED